MSLSREESDMSLFCELKDVLFELNWRNKFDECSVSVAVVGHIEYQFGTVLIIVTKQGNIVNSKTITYPIARKWIRNRICSRPS